MSTIKEVAKLANVSPGTVSNAFQKPEKVAPDTLKRIMDASRALHYAPNPLARALVTSKTKLIGLLVSYAFSANRGLAVNEFVREASGKGYMVVIGSTDLNEEEEERQINRFIQYHVDGVVVYSDYVEGRTAHLRRLAENQIPCVVIKRFDPAYENISVSSKRAFTLIADQLVRFHHRSVGAIVQRLYFEDGRESVRVQRIRTFQTCLKERGLCLADKDVLVADGKDMAAGERAVNQWFASGHELPTVFLCMYDHLAVGVVKGLQRRGYRVPEDVSVVGYGNYDVGQYCSPQLATVAANETDLVLTALHTLLDRIEDPSLPLKNLTMEQTFILRESLGQARDC